MYYLVINNIKYFKYNSFYLNKPYIPKITAAKPPGRNPIFIHQVYFINICPFVILQIFPEKEAHIQY